MLLLVGNVLLLLTSPEVQQLDQHVIEEGPIPS